ncbi:MAG: YcaQ family DNA glycosylase [Candidatus Fermentibacteraceae bacterium]|nr:YcaQ family DNA glycosylase [Candidatus Fermentibacteraceae bacterium]MBN2608095.1 YcaQ family DNA glycosylase [Candidatus Fermentibacteraceae bacterium]
MSSRLELTSAQARVAALRCQQLAGPPPLGGRETAARLVEDLGYIQIDTISVVNRAHHHTMWTRMENYEPEMLCLLQSEDRKVFEYWGHAASYLPMKDYRYYTLQMRNHRDPMSKWAKDRLGKCGHLMDDILERIRGEGALGSKDFESAPGVRKSQWWDWKPAKTVLELLFWRGDLMITRREKFHRIYDLTERVLPPGTDTTVPGTDELGRFMVSKALNAHGAATEKSISDHIHAAGRKIVRSALGGMTADGEVLAASVDGEDGYYVLAGSEYLFQEPIQSPKTVHILSPFDNLIIDRGRTERLFGFRYALECYTPREKREYGYFVLPVLWGDRFAARIDARADRKKRVLEVHSVHLEDGMGDVCAFLPSFASKLWDFARWNRCGSIDIGRVLPGRLLHQLKRELRKREQETPHE